MGWSDLERPEQGDKEAQKKLEAREDALKKTCRALINSDEGKPLRDFLTAALQRSSYAPGRSEADVAYCEGYRAMARTLLKSGGHIHE